MNVSSDLKKTLRWAVPAACALIVLAAGVVKYKSGEQPADPGEADKPVGMVNPIAEKASLKEVEDALGLKIVLPEGAEDLRFSVISGDLAHISFKLDGSEYTLRASELKDDFSGLYGEKTYEEKLDGGALLETINASGPIWQRLGWQEGSAGYMLLSESEDTEGVKKAYESIKGL